MNASPPARHAGIDAARAGTTLLVVLHHTAITYGAIGGWYYKELLPGDAWALRLLVFFCTVNQAWFMGFFFLLAGYFTPAALAAKGGWGFLKARAGRLGLPLLFYGFVIGPFTIALARTARGQPVVDTLLSLWRQGVFEPGPMWFAWALLLLAAATVVATSLLPGLRQRLLKRDGPPRTWPSNRIMVVAALATGLLAFGLRLRWPVGTEVAHLQLGYFASYGVLYVAGLWGAAPQWLADWPEAQVRWWRRVAWATLPVLPLVALFGGRWWGLQGQAEGGFSVLALVYALWEPLLAWGVILSVLQRGQRHFSSPGWLGQALARRAFTIYVIHPPVVVAVALVGKAVVAPALLKFAVTGSLSCLLCFWLAGALLRLGRRA
ncbi:acyltransferase family protein [Burkholderiales bacterium JOSHI_001]|nr:acyltransferase family protein [Burkholderiales bacterium JOSHI_001]